MINDCKNERTVFLAQLEHFLERRIKAMKIRKIMLIMLSMLVCSSFSLPSLSVAATANEIIEETMKSETTLSDTSADVQTTTADLETTYETTTTTADSETTYTTTPDPGMIEATTTTTTAVIEDLDYPYKKPFELTVYCINDDKKEWMANVSMELRITHQKLDAKGNVLDHIVTTEKLTTGDEGYAVYKAELEMLNNHEFYSFSIIPEIPEGFRFDEYDHNCTAVGFYGVDVKRNSDTLSKEMEFHITQEEDPFADSSNPLGTGIYTTTTTTNTSNTIITTTTTTTTSDTTTTTTATAETTTTYIRTTPYADISGFDTTADIGIGESITMDINTFYASTITFSSDNQYITIDGETEYGFPFDEGKFTIDCADDAVAGKATVTITYRHSLTNEVAEKTISINIVDRNAELPQTGYPNFYKLVICIAIIMTVFGAVTTIRTKKENQ